jgi:hypothetical protein
MELAGSRKTKSPANAGLFEESDMLIGAYWSSLDYLLAETEDSPTYCRPQLGLQAKPFKSLTRCPQGHRWLRLITKRPLSSGHF